MLNIVFLCQVPLPSDLESGLSNMPEKGPSTEPSSSLPPGVSSSVAPKEVHSETDTLGESHQKERPQQAGIDSTLLLTEQFAVMLALKDSFLPAFGGAHTELGKMFVNVLGNVFSGLSVDKVITEEMDVLQKAKSTVSHIDMIDSLRESRAGSSLGRALSPAGTYTVCTYIWSYCMYNTYDYQLCVYRAHNVMSILHICYLMRTGIYITLLICIGSDTN